MHWQFQCDVIDINLQLAYVSRLQVMKSRSSLIGQERMTNKEPLDNPIIEAQASTTTYKDVKKLNISSVSKSLGEARTSWASSDFETESCAPQA